MIQIPEVSPDVLAALSQYDTPTICNGIELFNVRSRTGGYMDGRIQCCFPKLPPMVGYAITAKFIASDSSRSGGYQTIVEHAGRFAAWAAPTVVVIEDLDRPSVAAAFGEVICSGLQACGVAGLVTSGAGRDLDQVEAIGFPAFVNSAICSHGYCSIVETDTPVSVGGITIKPGDLLHGDRNGVSTIPVDIAAELPEACKKIAASEKIVFDYLQAGSVTSEGLSDILKQWGKLRKELAEPFKKVR